jgi:hypothetical protein
MHISWWFAAGYCTVILSLECNCFLPDPCSSLFISHLTPDNLHSVTIIITPPPKSEAGTVFKFWGLCGIDDAYFSLVDYDTIIVHIFLKIVFCRWWQYFGQERCYPRTKLQDCFLIQKSALCILVRKYTTRKSSNLNSSVHSYLRMTHSLSRKWWLSAHGAVYWQPQPQPGWHFLFHLP